MPTRMKNTLSDQMMGHRILVDNCLSDPGISSILARFGYSPEALKAESEKLKQLEAAQATQDAEYGDQLAATEAVEKAWKKAREQYNDALTLARMAFKTDLDAQRALRLNGDRRNSLSGWLEDAKVFYQQLLTNTAWAKALERYDYNASRLTQEQAGVDEVSRLKSVQEKEKGEAKGATEARDKLLDEVNEWFGDLKEVVKVAFRADPQKVERLGLVVLNKPRAKKKEPVAAKAAK